MALAPDRVTSSDGGALARSDHVRRLLGPTAVVTASTIAVQLITFAGQVVVAAAFGTRSEMDAFVAASTLPQYVSAIILNSLSVVFVPVFIEHNRLGKGGATEIVNATVTWSVLVLLVTALVGIVCAGTFLRWTAPGLMPPARQIAILVAWVAWPGVVFATVATLATGILQAQGRFTWSSMVPALAAVFNLVLVLALVGRAGVVGVAIAATLSLALQVALLMRVFSRQHGGFRLSFGAGQMGFLRVVHLIWPLVLASAIYRANPLVDRYWASQLGVGVLAQLGYAFKLVSSLQMLLATGITTVIFPRMAEDAAGADGAALRRTLGFSMRLMWVAVAPVVTIGAVLALPVVTGVFRRGAFTAADAEAVADLLRIYLFALIGGCLGNLSARAFYALKKTRTVAVLGTIDAIGYACYTPYLAQTWGAHGIAAAYGLYLSAGLLTQLVILHLLLARGEPTRTLSALAKIAVASCVAAGASSVVLLVVADVWSQVVSGSLIGVVAYITALKVLGCEELTWLRLKRKPPDALALPLYPDLPSAAPPAL